jgi:hypothetical protein
MHQHAVACFIVNNRGMHTKRKDHPGSPGMEQGGRRDRYEVLLFQRDSRHATYARY